MKIRGSSEEKKLTDNPFEEKAQKEKAKSWRKHSRGYVY